MSAPAAEREAHGLVRSYRSLPGVFDEMIGPDGRLRPAWTRFGAALERAGPDGLLALDRAAARVIRENGITYNVYGEGADDSRPWPYDVVPLLFGAEDWAVLAAGLRQRARLLNAFLEDAFGARRVVREGVLPPALLFANPAFLRACIGVPVPEALRLHLYAADVVRLADGGWCVVADRGGLASGAGYALENRIVAARTEADLLTGLPVERLAGFFRAARDELLRLAGRDDPRIVLLTPGPGHEAYFEHAYLARYLGYALVEGGDLTVRDERVFLQTVDGLKPVDLIVRRVDTRWADPLDFETGSLIGIPGLMQAVRARRVVVANALGSSLTETDALTPFLPALSRALLGEELALPSLRAWWCGDPAQRAEAEARADELSFGPAFRRRNLAADDDRGGAGLRERLHRQGHLLVARERPMLATAPAWIDGRLVPRAVCLRAFAAASCDDWQVMPGGLARVVPGVDDLPASMQRGDAAKDCLVVADKPSRHVSLLRPPAAERFLVRRRAQDLPSRTADNLFWLGRYAERAEAIARLLRSTAMRLGESKGVPPPEGRLRATIEAIVPAAAHRSNLPVADLVLHLVVDRASRGGLAHSLAALGGAAALVRERLSRDASRTLHDLASEPLAEAGRDHLDLDGAIGVLGAVIRDLAAFAGMAMENMTRGTSWVMLDLGRRLERGLGGVALLTPLGAADDPEADGTLEWLLDLADSFMTYRTRYLAAPMLGRTLDLLLLDPSNPRALAFQLKAIAEQVAALPRPHGQVGEVRTRRLARSALDLLGDADVRALCALGPDGRRGALLDLLRGLDALLLDLSDGITRSYFRHTPPAHATIERFGRARAV